MVHSNNWAIKFPKAGVNNMPIQDSDHSPILLDTVLEKDRLKFPFRFMEAWVRDPSCREVIRESWSLNVQGPPSFRLMQRIHCTRRALRWWNKTYFGFCQDRLRVLERVFEQIQGLPLSQSNLQREAEFQLEIVELWYREDNIWKQKSRKTWLRDGDCNTKFFHALAIQKKRNHVWGLKDDGGRWYRERWSMAAELMTKFGMLFSSTNPSINNTLDELFDYQISLENDEQLCRIPLAEEVRKVVWSMNPLKAPGPVGMSGIFL